MTSGGRQAMVGAFVLGGIGLALAAIVLFGKFNPFHQSIRATIVFKDSIAGLSVGAPVTFRGVRVGSVDGIGIEFDPKTSVALIPVTVTFGSGRTVVVQRTNTDNVDLPDLITRGLRAELNVQSFVTGQSQIDLDFDPASPPALHPGISKLPEIPTRQSTLQKATEQLRELPLRDLVENSLATLKSLRDLSERLDHDLPPLIGSLRTASDRSAEMVGSAGQAIAELQGRLDTTLGAIGALAVTGDRQLTQRGGELHTLLTSSDQALRQVRDLVVDLKGLTSDRSAARANVESSLRDLAAAAASLRGFAADVERDPRLLLTGRKP